jgi:hypothetical protein
MSFDVICHLILDGDLPSTDLIAMDLVDPLLSGFDREPNSRVAEE